MLEGEWTEENSNKAVSACGSLQVTLRDGMTRRDFHRPGMEHVDWTRTLVPESFNVTFRA